MSQIQGVNSDSRYVAHSTADAVSQVENLFKLRLGSWGLLAVSLGLVGSGMTTPVLAAKAFFALGAAITSTMSKKMSTEADNRDDSFRDIQTHHRAMVQGGLLDLFNTAPLPTVPDANVSLFDWSQIAKDPDNYPHFCILGETGSGKSTLAEWLVVMAAPQGSIRIAIAPHGVKKGSRRDWQGFDVIQGSGRSYGEPPTKETEGEPIPEWTEVIAGGNFSCYQTLYALLAEMTRRYQMREQGDHSFESQPVEVYIDEIPAIYGALGKAFTSAIRPLLLEARKVRIRLYLLTQGEQVKMLGLEGQSSIRDSMVFIRLNRFASKMAKLLARRKHLDQDVLNWLAGQSRKCLVDGLDGYQAAKVPGLTEMNAVIEACDTKVTVQSPEVPTGHGLQPQKSEKSIFENTEYTRINPDLLKDFRDKSFTGERYRARKSAEYWLNQGKSKTYIIEKVWNLGGQRFAEALLLWDLLNLNDDLEMLKQR